MSSIGSCLTLCLDWQHHADLRIKQWTCLVCGDRRFRLRHHLEVHEQSDGHLLALTRFQEASALQSQQGSDRTTSVNNEASPMLSYVEDGLRNLVYALAGDTTMLRDEDALTTAPRASATVAPSSVIDWGLDYQENILLDHRDEQQAVREIAHELYSRLDDPPDSSDEEAQEWSDEDVPVDEAREPVGNCKFEIGGSLMTTKGLPILSTTVDDDNDPESVGGSRKRARRANQDAAPSRHWYPWEDHIMSLRSINTQA